MAAWGKAQQEMVWGRAPHEVGERSKSFVGAGFGAGSTLGTALGILELAVRGRVVLCPC